MKAKWWHDRWYHHRILWAWVDLRFVVANLLHKQTRICWETWTKWAMGIGVDTVRHCDLCAGCDYTWCGRKR